MRRRPPGAGSQRIEDTAIMAIDLTTVRQRGVEVAASAVSLARSPATRVTALSLIAPFGRACVRQPG
jgi:hypothetical protein